MPPRRHIVLVPGFVGFDALGQLEYYAGVTRVFEEWHRKTRRDVSLHYFDNFPTASVAHRAQRLNEYLLKRIARGEFAVDDQVTLVGHSTGGLDIRRAIYDLAAQERDSQRVDSLEVENTAFLRRLDSIVFLSTPHYGTNLADFAYRLGDSIQGLLQDAQLALWLNREPLATWRRLLAPHVFDGASDLLLAVADALNESDESPHSQTAELASERAARAQLGLWLEHMSKDFSVVADLRSASGKPENSTSPAHFDAAQRANELQFLANHQINTRSYVTVVPARTDLARTIPGLIRSLVGPTATSINELSKLLNVAADAWWLTPVSLTARAARLIAPTLGVPALVLLLRSRPDVVFNVFYALCADAAGPFEVDAAEVAPDLTLFDTRGTIPSTEIAKSDSDGVVNTRSMLWPYDAKDPGRHVRFLVRADHADIIGHHTRDPRENATPYGRKYDAYDIFPSGSGFKRPLFEAVWNDIFESCT